MDGLLNIFVKSIFVDNMVFAYFFGMCSYIAVSKSVKTAMGLGMAVTFVMVTTVSINWLLDRYVLQAGALEWLGSRFEGVDLSFLSFIMFIAVIASFAQLVEMVIEKFVPALYNSLGIFLPLIAVHCAIMGGSLFMQERAYENIGEAATFAFGSGIGWWLAIIMMAAIREKMTYSNVPRPLRGAGITFIITGLAGLAFMSFLGIQM